MPHERSSERHSCATSSSHAAVPFRTVLPHTHSLVSSKRNGRTFWQQLHDCQTCLNHYWSQIKAASPTCHSTTPRLDSLTRLFYRSSTLRPNRLQASNRHKNTFALFCRKSKFIPR